MTNNQSESLSLKRTKGKDQKKKLPQESEEFELEVDEETIKQNIDFSPHVRVGNLLIFKEYTAIEVILPIPVSYIGMLESASAREWWGKDSFGDSPTWKNGLSWLYDNFLDRLEVHSDFFVPCDYWNISLDEENRKKAQSLIHKQIRYNIEKLRQKLLTEEPFVCRKPENLVRRKSMKTHRA